MPATPSTRAWPPSLPSVPTSRATRVTSEAKELSWSTMMLTILPMRRNSPRRGRPSISSIIVCDRSPLATAPMTRATSVVGWTRSPIRVLMESTHCSHSPVAPGSRARWPILPSLPTTELSRPNSSVIFWLSSTTSLKASVISASMPVKCMGRRTEKSPLRNRRRAASRSRADSSASTVSGRAILTMDFLRRVRPSAAPFTGWEASVMTARPPSPAVDRKTAGGAPAISPLRPRGADRMRHDSSHGQVRSGTHRVVVDVPDDRKQDVLYD